MYENLNTYIRTAAETTATRRRRAEVTENKAKQSFFYDRGSKELNDLQPGDVVRIQPPQGIGRKP